MALLLDANIAFMAGTREEGFEYFGDQQLLGPPLLWPETRSILHVALYRQLISARASSLGLERLESGRITEQTHTGLGTEAWRIADELGWSKTYDAEYLALASLLDVPIVTFDRRMHRAAQRLGLEAQTPA